MRISTFDDLKQLFIEGGIEIKATENGKIVMRTLIQPDGDVTMHIAEEIPDDAVHQDHLKKTREKITSISIFISLLNSAGFFSVVPAAFFSITS